jgi:hypothetical protein
LAENFRERIKHDILVCDGATGTLLYTKGIYINRCFEGLNLSSPDLVKEVHRDYIKVGADIIETNTYGANRFKLGPHGLESQLEKINRTGAEIARQVAGDRVYVAGSIGPIGRTIEPFGHVPRQEAIESFSLQAQSLAEGGVDLFILETFSNLSEMLTAIEAVRAVSDLPIIAQMTVSGSGMTLFGDSPEKIAETCPLNRSTWSVSIVRSAPRKPWTPSRSCAPRLPCPFPRNPMGQSSIHRRPNHLYVDSGVHGGVRRSNDSQRSEHRRRLLRHLARPHQSHSRRGPDASARGHGPED